jgi:hypothetical protein
MNKTQGTHKNRQTGLGYHAAAEMDVHTLLYGAKSVVYKNGTYWKLDPGCHWVRKARP